MVHTATIHLPEVRTTVLLMIAVAAVLHLLPEAAAIPAEVVAAVLLIVAEAAVAVRARLVAVVEAVAVAEVEDKTLNNKKLRL